MKTPSFIFLCLFVAVPLAYSAVTLTPAGIFVEGTIEGSDIEPVFKGDTIDYLTFEVTTPGHVRLIGTNLRSSVFLAMGVVVGNGEPFDGVGLPYLLFDNYPQTTPPEFTHLLNPGRYLVQIAEEEAFEGDLYAYDFLPVNRLGGGFVRAPYSFALEGPVRGIDFMEGNLNGTFTITRVVPEPSTAALLGVAMGMVGFTRRRRT